MPTKIHFDQLKTKLSARPKDAHKGTFGHALIVGGAPGFSGAARLAAEACLYTGAGVVSVATHPDHANILNIGRPELMCHGIENSNALEVLLDKADVILIGPGLGQDTWGSMCWNTTLKTKKPLVLDADALNLLAKNPRRNPNWVLTPHPGEAARLSILNTAEEIQAKREAAIQQLQKDYEGVIVLKGANTLIADEKNIFVNTFSNAALATAGMGDVLSGIITGLLAQGLSSIDAATLAVTMQSAAAEKILASKKRRIILAQTLAEQLLDL